LWEEESSDRAGGEPQIQDSSGGFAGAPLDAVACLLSFDRLATDAGRLTP
jgi:hypothetical protein